jgi:divinyl chlorophyllide a 8-vinyl-reductase
LGATGTIGRATLRALVARGHEVVAFVRKPQDKMARVEFRVGDVTDSYSVKEHGLRGERFEAVVSCLASRTGMARDAWAIDYKAHSGVLKLAKDHGIPQMVLLSAICVQKPKLAFQQAKLAFEQELIQSGLTFSIVRPTAFFKSLSGQVERVKAGKPFMIFGDGKLTGCKPISDDDLGSYMADCLDDKSRHNKILPIGGPEPAITPREQGEILFAALGRAPKFRSVPVDLLKFIRSALSGLGVFSRKLADKAELAGIGLYYATESMLVWDEAAGCYDAKSTPSTGTQTLADHYARLIRGEIADDRGDHAVF